MVDPPEDTRGPDSSALPDSADVIVVGAGPAGLAAAVALRAQGVARVLVLDREPQAGGIPRHCAHSPYGLREFGRLLTGPAYARRLVAQARAAGVDIRTGVSVTALHPGPRLSVTSDAGPQDLQARAVLLTTGVRETSRAGRLIGGTKPGGVIATGALQALVHLERQRPFRRPLIVGTELVAFSALMTCRQAGIRPVAMLEPGPRPTARWPAVLYPWLLGVPVWPQTDLLAIEGGARVTGAVVRDAQGTRRIDTDGILITGRFRPEAALVQAGHLRLDPATGGPEVDCHGRCSDPGFFAAGNLLRAVETAGRCWAEGRAIGVAIARALAGRLPAPAAGPALGLAGTALAYAMPQRGGGADGAALGQLQIRVRRAVAGRLSLRVDGTEVAGHRLRALPERRIFLPLPPEGAGRVEVVLTEDGA